MNRRNFLSTVTLAAAATPLHRTTGAEHATLGGATESAHRQWRQLPPLPDPCGFASPFVGVSNGVLLVAGGANFPREQLWQGGKKIWHDRIYALRPGREQWELIGRLPELLGYGVSVTTEEGLLLIGGGNAESHTAKVRWLQVADDRITWRDLPALPRPTAMAAGALVGRVVYVAGGLESPQSKTALNTCYALDLERPEAGWTMQPPVPGPGRSQAVAAAAGEHFYLFSGVTYEVRGQGAAAMIYLSDAYRYSAASGWERLPDLPMPALAAASPAPVHEGEIMLIGGIDGTKTAALPQDFPLVPQRIQSYSIRSQSWREAGRAPVGRVCVSTAWWQGAWILPSGERSAGVRSPEVWQLSLEPLELR